MIRDLVSALDYSICAEIALAFFVAAFIGILYTVSRLSDEATERFSSIPLDDSVKDPRHG